MPLVISETEFVSQKMRIHKEIFAKNTASC